MSNTQVKLINESPKEIAEQRLLEAKIKAWKAAVWLK